jgi:hypothetical protein
MNAYNRTKHSVLCKQFKLKANAQRTAFRTTGYALQETNDGGLLVSRKPAES